MSFWRLIFCSARFYWRSQLGVVLGTAVATMVLAGSLLVGDSVKATLRRQALDRVGRVESALLGGEGFFREALAEEVGGGSAPVLLLRGSAARVDGAARVNQAQVLGVDPRFWNLAPGPSGAVGAGVWLNEQAAAQLHARKGDTVVVRVEKPALFSRDAPLSGEESQVVALRLEVAGVVGDAQFGRFGLQAAQVPPSTVFVPLGLLQERLQMKGRANVLLAPGMSSDQLSRVVSPLWQLADAGFELRALPAGRGTELRSSRVFFHPVDAGRAGRGTDALTYLVNEIAAGGKTVPYSIVSATDAASSGFLPAELADDEIAINQWLAEDLGAALGDWVTLKYFAMGERRELEERTRRFRVFAVVPMDEPQLDGTWMPDFPGLSDKKSCRDWKPGFAMDTTRFRDKDEQYWAQHRGTPKAFVNIMVGQEMWANRWGSLTSVRYPGGTDASALEAELRSVLRPESAGARFLAMREQALAATRAPVDFGELFVSFSFFLIVAAAVLTGMLFVFSVEQRRSEAGLLLALGWLPARVRRLFLAEGLVLAAAGVVAGAAAAVGFTRGVLHALETVWSGAVGSVSFVLEVRPGTLAAGGMGALMLAGLAMMLAARRQFSVSPSVLLSGAPAGVVARGGGTGRGRWIWIAGWSCVVGAGLLAAADAGPGAFFGAGGLLLCAGLAGCVWWLRRTEGEAGAGVALTIGRLGVRNAARRSGRSLATVSVLASGIFIVVAVDSFRQRPGEGAAGRDSGTGGFALVGESALAVYEDLNTAKGREAFALSEEVLKGVGFVPMRVRDGDDASCLNLNRALEPRLLGVRPSDLAGRGAFRLSWPGNKDWLALDEVGTDGAVPGVVDEATLQWALQKKIGDVIEYRDEGGKPFMVRVAAVLKGSMLQGSVLVAEKRLVERYPSHGGYRFFLVDVPEGRLEAVAAELSRALQDRGLEVVPAWRRLAGFHAVENTYLSIFQVLGALGLVLGSAGLAVVVVRNMLERRAEFALLAALGFRPGQMRWMAFAEYGRLIVMGVGIGAGSAVLAVWPALRERAGGFPGLELWVLAGVLLAWSVFWAWVAIRLALRGVGVGALRGE